MSDDDRRDDEDSKDTDKPDLPESNFEKGPTAEILDFASLSDRLRTKYEEEKEKAGDKADAQVVGKRALKAVLGIRKSADVIADLADEVDLLFHTPDGTAYADVFVDFHRETHPVQGKRFEQYLRYRYWLSEKEAPSAEAIRNGIAMAAARALYEGPEVPVHVRTAECDNGDIYIDLADEAWRAVKVTKKGWKIVTNPDVRFRRSNGMLPIPDPIRGGSVDALRPFINCNDENFVLIVSWLVAAMYPKGPYPILSLHGEAGSAKTTMARVLRSLVDPSTASVRSLPKDERDLVVSANASYVVSFDNVSRVSNWLSDALCRLSTGGGWAARQLFTDLDVVILDITRPCILNGVPDFVERGDFADRVLRVTLEPIPDDKRAYEADIYRAVDDIASGVFGALLDALVVSLKRSHDVKLKTKPRMADFARRIVAAESVLPWRAGEFMRIYGRSRQEATEQVLEADVVAVALRTFMKDKPDWYGSATELLTKLDAVTDEIIRHDRSWPKRGNDLSSRLTRLAPDLRKIGVDVDRERRGKGGARKLIITKPALVGKVSSPSSSLSLCQRNQKVEADNKIVEGDKGDNSTRDQGDNVVSPEPAKTNKGDNGVKGDNGFRARTVPIGMTVKSTRRDLTEEPT